MKQFSRNFFFVLFIGDNKKLESPSKRGISNLHKNLSTISRYPSNKTREREIQIRMIVSLYLCYNQFASMNEYFTRFYCCLYCEQKQYPTDINNPEVVKAISSVELAAQAKVILSNQKRNQLLDADSNDNCCLLLFTCVYSV